MNPDLEASSLLNHFAGQDTCRQLLAELTSGKGKIVPVYGLTGSARQLLMAATSSLKRIHVVILDNREDAMYCYSDLNNLLSPEQVYFFPSSFKSHIQHGQPDPSHIVQRTAALNAMLEGRLPVFIVTFLDALYEKIASRETVENNAIRLQRGEKISPGFLRETLTAYGFERTDFVSEPGQFALRGSIVDVFSFSNNRPIRVDFFGDEVESIRTFNVNTQLSEEIIDSFEIIANLQDKLQVEQNSTLFEFTGENSILWTENAQLMLDQLALRREQEEARATLITTGDIIKALHTHSTVCFGTVPAEINTTPAIHFNTSPQPSFNKKFDLLAADISSHAEQGYTTYILTENPTQAERLRTIFASMEKGNVRYDLLPLTLHEGFIDHTLHFCCYTDHQLFERYHRVTLRREVEKSERLTLQELGSLQIGDYVVHIDHGIGVFGGLVKTDVNGKIQEAVKLVYRDNDVLIVNIHGLHRISKYKGKDGEQPKIYKLGTGTWLKLKQTTKSKVKDIARELIALYAKRKETTGFAFSPDTYLQNELEASFIYEDTPDQLKATQAVKADMELPHPMDRLVCGDVGFGKTEVAIRAAFKAVIDNKQVAVLVPTTILALQHYKTFSERLGNFPVGIDYISRLKPAKKIKETLQETAEGKIDILIGTHRLLNKDVKFKDMGLLIVDEEQKFGVSAKEKLRTMKLNVDTLTMSATPIPRTLQFSLMGARDLSIINTPPPNRHPIITEIHTFREDIISTAINYEVERGGQVFFLHNRTQDIREIEDIVRRICPGVKTCTGHGQMPPETLEKVILDFMHGDYDVLISTTIIENGIDIPNANTIIINQAQNFGLSDLHQLRGRVGRSNRKAFCYLITPPIVSLTNDARRRLKAIEAFSELGSGFNIAMQDLDIRGAGNILGSEQSGFISDIGFETYQRILNEALLELQDEIAQTSTEEKPDNNRELPEKEKYIHDCIIDTDMEILLPDNYINHVAEKIRLYKELDNLPDEQALQNFINRLIDRFGTFPEPVRELCNIVRLRWMAVDLGFEKIVLKNKMMTAYFVSNQHSSYYRSAVFSHILAYIQAHSRLFKVKEQNGKLILSAVNILTVKQAIELLQKMK